MIHESGNALDAPDRERLQSQAETEEDKILSFLKCRRGEAFAAFEIADLLWVREGNARRALSNLSGSIRRHVDDYGNYPLVKRTDLKKRDPRTGVRVCTYQYNPRYGVLPAREPVQSELFPARRYVW